MCPTPGPTPVSHTLLRGVDRASFATALAVRLRAHGVAVGFSGAEDFVRALSLAWPASRSQLYWVSRISFVRRHSDLAAFDAVFAAVFDAATRQRHPPGRGDQAGEVRAAERGSDSPGEASGEPDTAALPWATRPRAIAVAEGVSDSDSVSWERLPVDVSALADVPFEQLSAEDMARLGHWLESALRAWPMRRSRRLHPAQRGRRIAIRPTLARSRRTGWEPVELVRVRAVDRPRRVVMLCDVSQSMQPQAGAYFHLMRALALGTDAELFAFATALTRLTVVLAHHSAQTAMEDATSKVRDRFGGTRLASALRTLLNSHHGAALRGAVVIIGSDGWDSGPAAELAAAMARLRRRAYRVIWVNPRVCAPGFQPLVAGMAAALPYCDRLLPGDTFGSLARVVDEISQLGSGANSRGSRGSRAGSVPR